MLTRRQMLAGGLSIAACSPPSAHALESRRLVVAGGALTETVVALGVAGRLVGVDTTSLFPATAVQSVPKIGYFRSLSAEGILSLDPSLLLASDQAGPPAVFSQLRAAGLPLAVVPETFDPDHVIEKIRRVATIIEAGAAGAAMAEMVALDLAAVRRMVAGLKVPRALFILSTSGDRIMAAGQATAAEAMIELAGARNAIQGYTSYKPLSAEAAVAADADVIVVPDHVLTALGGYAGLAKIPQVAATRAAAEKRIVSMDSLYLLGLGPRTAHAARDLAVLLHPDASIEQLPARPWTVG